MHMQLKCSTQSFQVSSPVCTLHMVITDMITVLECVEVSHVQHTIGIHWRF